MLLSQEAEMLVKDIEAIEMRQLAKEQSKLHLEDSIKEYESKLSNAGENYQVAVNAIEVLRTLSNTSVQSSYKYMEQSINEALRRIFTDRVRQIELRETMRGNYPQLEIALHVENGVERSLKYSSGHGIAQVISLLCILSLIVFTGGRRFLVLDEVMSGMSQDTRRLFDDVLWEFSTIGFQYVIVEHDYTPKGAYVVQLESKNELSRVTKTWINEVEELGGETEENYVANIDN
jgi:DNA repair exonuclease SbcCD ATPase subunit